MGVSIGWRKATGDRVTWIEPGWRSMMHQLLLDNGLYGLLEENDLPIIREVGRVQLRGQKEPPFDWAEDIREAFEKLATAIEKHGRIVTVFEF